jgi:nucleoside-diphosphate-sugar epimerase
LAGVYGPGEQVILGRSVDLISCEIARNNFSQKENLLIDFVHIKNVVQAHVKVKKYSPKYFS